MWPSWLTNLTACNAFPSTFRNRYSIWCMCVYAHWGFLYVLTTATVKFNWCATMQQWWLHIKNAKKVNNLYGNSNSNTCGCAPLFRELNKKLFKRCNRHLPNRRCAGNLCYCTAPNTRITRTTTTHLENSENRWFATQINEIRRKRWSVRSRSWLSKSRNCRLLNENTRPPQCYSYAPFSSISIL